LRYRRISSLARSFCDSRNFAYSSTPMNFRVRPASFIRFTWSGSSMAFRMESSR